jgi:hypothetical protein
MRLGLTAFVAVNTVTIAAECFRGKTQAAAAAAAVGLKNEGLTKLIH